MCTWHPTKNKNQQLTLSWSAAVRGRVSVRFNAISGHDAEVRGMWWLIKPKGKWRKWQQPGIWRRWCFCCQFTWCYGQWTWRFVFLGVVFESVVVFLGVILLLHTCCYSYRMIHDRYIWAYTPRTQMTLILIGKGLVLGRLTFKNIEIEVIVLAPFFVLLSLWLACSGRQLVAPVNFTLWILHPNSSPLKNDGWKEDDPFLLGLPCIFLGGVSC